MSGRLTCCNNNDIIHVHTQVWQDGLIRAHCISVTTATLLLQLDVSDLKSPQEAWYHSTAVFVCCTILGNGWMAKGSVKRYQTSAKVYCHSVLHNLRSKIGNRQPCNCSRQSDTSAPVWNYLEDSVGILQFERKRKANSLCLWLSKHGSTTGASFPHQLAKCSTHKFFRQNKPGAPKNAH